MTKNDKNPSLKEQLAALDELLGWFDSDDFAVEAASAKLAAAAELASAIKAQLEAVSHDITIVKRSFDDAA